MAILSCDVLHFRGIQEKQDEIRAGGRFNISTGTPLVQGQDQITVYGEIELYSSTDQTMQRGWSVSDNEELFGFTKGLMYQR